MLVPLKGGPHDGQKTEVQEPLSIFWYILDPLPLDDSDFGPLNESPDIRKLAVKMYAHVHTYQLMVDNTGFWYLYVGTETR